MKRLLQWLRGAWLIAGVTLLCVLLADAALRRLLPASGLAAIDPRVSAPAPEATDALAGQPWVSAYFAELRAARKTRWESYSYWRRQPFAGEHIHVDGRGIRRGWVPPQARLKLLMFGGSTVWGTGSRDDHTLPSALARVLNEHGLAVEIVNMGETGYVSGQEIAALIGELRRGPPPDAVVFYDGVNDVYAALQSGRAGSPQNESHRERDFRVTDGLDNWLAAFPRVLEGVARLGAWLGSSTPPPPIPALGQEVVDHYLDNVRVARALGREFGFESWFFWQPSVFAKSPLSASEALIRDASLARHRDLQRATDAALATAMSPHVTDLSGMFSATGDPLFIDFCHLSEAGNRRVAERMAALLLAPLARLADQARAESGAPAANDS